MIRRRAERAAYAALRSATAARRQGGHDIRLRMNPEDMRDIRQACLPNVKRSAPMDDARLFGYPLDADETLARGEHDISYRAYKLAGFTIEGVA